MDGDLRLLTIVGIVGDIHEYGLDTAGRVRPFTCEFVPAAARGDYPNDAERCRPRVGRFRRRARNPAGPQP